MKREISLPKIRVSISEKCQLKCSFCGGEDSKMENFQPEEIDRPISKDKLLTILEKYVQADGQYVQFTGGEPLLCNDIYDIVRSVSDMGGIPEINTNGISITKEKAKKLADSGLNVLKISIPSFRRDVYKELTAVDCLQKVLRNIKDIKGILPVRINMVAMKHVLDEYSLAIDTCRDLGVNQLLLLELLYYPHIPGARKFFDDSFVDIKKDLKDNIEKKLQGIFEEFNLFKDYQNKLYTCKSSVDGFEVYYKLADPVLRIAECYNCPHFCQEGIYELRLSTGGYLSFCNICNQFGHDLSSSDDLTSVDTIFTKYKEIFASAKISTFSDFLKVHRF